MKKNLARHAALVALLLAACSRVPGAIDAAVTPSPSSTPVSEATAADSDLLPGALDALLRGCDLLDTAHCLFPFPNDHFTVAAAEGSIQSPARGGTGRRVNLNALAMPVNVLGRPVDPAEWNRNDGFTPGAMLVTYVPGLSLTETHGLPPEQIGIANPALSLEPDAPILVLEVPQAPEVAPTPHLVFGELDASAGILVDSPGEFQGIPLVDITIPDPNAKVALIVRPAINFREGRRYVAVLRKLKDAQGQPLAAQAGFATCRDRGESALPPVTQRCAALETGVFPVLEAAGIARDESLYLAWDFTVASTQNQIGRLRHMRDDAFATLATAAGADCLRHDDAAPCTAPQFTVDTVTLNPREGIAKRIEGTITLPSYVIPADPSPGESLPVGSLLLQFCDALPDALKEPLEPVCDVLETGGALAGSISLPPNHLYYAPTGGVADASHLDDPLGLRYGDGLPDRLPGAGTMTTRYLCQIPAQATPDNPARAGVYGHGLLDSRAAVNYDGVPDISREFNYLFCAVDWFGFATGDLANVLVSLVDASFFRVIPDASQQGMLNFMFLTRLLKHPQGFAAHPEFQQDGRAVFDRRHVFYDGNSQGGILGGVLMAASQDITRGALGSLGMNYSTLLNRSKDFDQFALFLYTSYQDALERQLLYSLMEMLWERSENNAYAPHLTDNSAFGGEPKIVKLDPQFGDHEVTHWSAEFMARVMGVPIDYSMTDRIERKLGNGPRNPDVQRGYGLATLDYKDKAQTSGGALIMWDDERTAIPPITNTPPRPEAPLDRNPHDDSAKKFSGRCHKAHFLREDGLLIDILPVEFDGAPCPPVPPAPPTPVLLR